MHMDEAAASRGATKCRTLSAESVSRGRRCTLRLSAPAGVRYFSRRHGPQRHELWPGHENGKTLNSEGAR